MKGDIHIASNYRPFSMTCVLYKLMEHINCKLNIWLPIRS